MIGKLIVTHGGLAKELLAAAETISGTVRGFEALSLDWHDSFDAARVKIAAALARLDEGQGVLLLTDMFGGTPCNVALTFLESGRYEVLSGVNLPMVLRLACQNGGEERGVTELARWLQAKGQRSVCLASDMVQPKPCRDQPEIAEPCRDQPEVAATAETER